MDNIIKIVLSSLLFIFSYTAFAKNVDNLPATLPEISSTPLGNTPEYVIIRASDEATFSSETNAEVAEILVTEGSTFKQNDKLLVLDCRIQEAELKKAKAEQQAANVAQVSAKKLKDYGSISSFEYVKATADSEVANAEVDKLNAIVDKCVIEAPFNGAVAELMVHAHESVKPGDPLLKIVNIENLVFEMQVPSCWLNQLHIGSDFAVFVNETKEVIKAKITRINPQIEPISESVKLIATITPAQKNLLPGMSGQAIFAEKPEKMCTKGKK